MIHHHYLLNLVVMMMIFDLILILYVEEMKEEFDKLLNFHFSIILLNS